MNIISLARKGLTLTLIISMSSCSSLASSSLRPLESRTYDISEKCDGFVWQYNKCVRRFLGMCLKSEIEVIKIEAEFKDKALCETLYDKDFVLKVREKPF